MLLAVTLPGTVELALLTLGALLPRRRPAPPAGGASLRLAVVVPAHDEQETIAACVASLRACRGAQVDTQIVVVADNCTDATAARAQQAGARVLVRHDPERRGKGYALDFAFSQLLTEPVDAVLVVDADTSASPELLHEVRGWLAGGADAVQVRYGVRNPDASHRTRLLHVALLAFNYLRPRGRHRLGLSAGLLGNGFALRREVVERVPYAARSVVEDLEYHLELIKAGYRVRFAEGAEVRADMPAQGAGVGTQRARWEGGRLRQAIDWAPRLAAAVLRGRLRLLEPLLDLALLPLAFHVVLLVVALTLPVPWVRTAAAAALAVVGLHVMAAVGLGGGGGRDLLALATAPLYVLWKLVQLPRVARAARRNAEWVRTQRAPANGGSDPGGTP
jgi:hypothetical protein